MRKYFIALFFCLIAGPAWAQCNGVWSANSLCGTGGSTGVPHELGPPLPLASGGTGGTSFTANLPVIGNGGGALTQGTRAGNTTTFATTTGTLTNGHCVQFDGNGNLIDAGGACTTGAGGGTVSAGTANQVTYYSGSGTVVAGAGQLFWDNTNTRITQGNTGTQVTIGGANALLEQMALNNNNWIHSSITSAGLTVPGNEFGFAKTRGAAPGTQTIVASGDEIAGYYFYGSDGTAYQQAGQLQFSVDGTPGSGSMPGVFTLATTPSGSTSSVERMRVDSAGHTILGGTASQSGVAQLEADIAGASATAEAVFLDWSANNNYVLAFARSKSNVLGTKTAVASADRLGEIDFEGIDSAPAFTNSSILAAEVDGTVSSGVIPGRLRAFTANSSGTLTERLRINSSGQIWGYNIEGYTDLRLWGTLACNSGAPTSSGVAQAAVNAYNAGLRAFYIPDGCFIYTGDTPWVSAFGSNTIPSATRWLGENWETSGFSVCSTYTGCTPVPATTMVGAGLILFQNLFTMDGACYNADSGAFGHPSRCPIVLQSTSAGTFSQGATYPGGGITLNVGAKLNGTWNGTDQPAFAINQETSGDDIFINDIDTNTNDNFLNFFNTHGAVIVAKLDGKSSFGTTSTIHAGNGMLHIVDATGTCDIFTNGSGGIGSTCTSDARLKRDIVDTGDELKWLNTFRIRDYTLRTDGNRYTGTVAQELMATHPDMVVEGDGGMLQVFAPNQWKMIRAMQQMQGEIEELQRKVN